MAPSTVTMFLPDEVAALAERLGVTDEVDLSQLWVRDLMSIADPRRSTPC